MDIKNIQKDGYNLHLIKNKNFKTTLFKVIFWKEIKEEELTKRSLLADNLLFSSNKYKTEKEIVKKRQDLYGASIWSNVYRKGRYMFLEMNISVIDEKYTNKGLLKESLDFFMEILKKPNIEDEKFNKQGFEITYEKLKLYLQGQKENPSYYSFTEYKKLLGEKIYTYKAEGKIEDLEKITPENLYEFYKTFYSTNNIDILVLGDIDFNNMEKLIEDKFLLKGTQNKVKDFYLSYEKDYSEEIKKTDYSQSTLIMGSSIKNLTNFEKKYASLAYNIILGSSPNSKLFKNIREKHSYTYNITSRINRIDGIFLIQAGISKENFQRVKEEVLKEIEEMKKGNFSLRDVKNAKEVLLSTLKEITDYQGSIVDYYFNYLYFDGELYETQKENIQKIDKESIIKVANKINIDTILLAEEIGR